MDVPVTVREAMAGGTIDIPTVDGQVKMKVPSGSQTGKVLRLKGKGAPHLKTKTRGNLIWQEEPLTSRRWMDRLK